MGWSKGGEIRISIKDKNVIIFESLQVYKTFFEGGAFSLHWQLSSHDLPRIHNPYCRVCQMPISLLWLIIN